MKTVLVVDDKKENSSLLQVLLTHHGYRVEIAHDGGEALAKARQRPPDMLITDILLPQMDGFALCLQWKADARLRHIPLVFYTATDTDPKDEQFALELGADAFLIKPAEPDYFMARIQAVLDSAVVEGADPMQGAPDNKRVLLMEYNQMLVHKLEQKLAQLEESERYSRMLFEHSPMGLALCRLDGTLIDVNLAFASILGRSVPETLGLTYWQITPEDYAGEEAAALACLEETGCYGPYEKEYLHLDGHRVPVSLRGQIIERNGERLIWSSVEDISARRAVEAKVQHLSNLYAALSHCKQAIVRCTNEDELFAQVCADAVKFGGMRMAWIGLVDEASHRVCSVAACGEGVEYLDGIRISVDADDPFGCGPTGVSIRNNQPFWCQDFLNDPAMAPWHERGQHAGWRASTSLPLCRNGHPIGSLMLYSGRINAFDDDVRSLLLEMATDISFALDNFAREAARQRAETALLKYETIVKNAGWGMVITDPNTNIMTYVNPAFAHMHGYELGEMDGMNLAETFAPESRSALPALARAAHDKGHLFYESVHVRKNGTVFPCQTDVTVFKDAGGQVLFRAATFEDITERKRTEESLRQSFAQMKHFIQQAPISIAMFDTSMNYLAVSDRWMQGYGRGNASLLGLNHYQVLPDIPAEWRLVHQQGLAGATLKNDNDMWIDADGYQNWLRWAVVPWTDDDGAIGGIIISTEDITDRKRAEQEVLQLNAELELRVSERTMQLADANHELETFVYSVSHDLKAPLRGIDGYSQLLQEECSADLSAECNLFVGNIRQGVLQMSNLIDDLLAYSRIERRELQKESLNLADIARAVVAERAGEIRASHAEVSVSMASLIAPVDREGLLVVLRNLLENALKFSRDAHSPVIEIGGRDENDSCILWVRDNGIGFDMKFHDRIFDIFQRLQRIEDFPGTGIGLALVRKAMQRMGGRVWAQSAPGQGATFYLALPK